MRPLPFVLALFFVLSAIAGEVPAGEARFRLGAAYLDLGEKGYALEACESLEKLDREKTSELQQMIARSSPQ